MIREKVVQKSSTKTEWKAHPKKSKNDRNMWFEKISLTIKKGKNIQNTQKVKSFEIKN